LNESRATRYQRLRRRARAASFASGAAMLAAIACSPASTFLAGTARSVAASVAGAAQPIAATGVLVGIIVLVWQLASLPAIVFLSLRVDRAYGRASGGPVDLLAAHVETTAAGFATLLAAALAIEWSMRVAGSWWVVPASLLVVAGLVLALRIAPAVVARVPSVRPLSRPELAADIARLAARARVPVAGVHEWIGTDAETASALVTGTGNRRRILIGSEVVRHWTDDEILVVVAHELAHLAYRDLWRTLALDAAILVVGLCAADAVAMAGRAHDDLAVLPLILATVTLVWTVATPLRHALSRRQERRADVFALGVTGGAEAFTTAVRRLGARRLAEERPSGLTRWFFHTHPSVAERLAVADAYRRLRLP
jgi:STE24 endopeptidase